MPNIMPTLETVCTISKAKEFNQFLQTLRPIVTSRGNIRMKYFAIDFATDTNGKPYLIAIACDGYRLIRQIYQPIAAQLNVLKAFNGNMSYPRYLPRQSEQVCIVRDENNTLGIQFANITEMLPITEYPWAKLSFRPEPPDLHKLLEQVSTMHTKQNGIYASSNYVKDAATALASCPPHGQKSADTVYIEIGQQHQPIRFTDGINDHYILPRRGSDDRFFSQFTKPTPEPAKDEKEKAET